MKMFRGKTTVLVIPVSRSTYVSKVKNNTISTKTNDTREVTKTKLPDGYTWVTLGFVNSLSNHHWGFVVEESDFHPGMFRDYMEGENDIRKSSQCKNETDSGMSIMSLLGYNHDRCIVLIDDPGNLYDPMFKTKPEKKTILNVKKPKKLPKHKPYKPKKTSREKVVKTKKPKG